MYRDKAKRCIEEVTDKVVSDTVNPSLPKYDIDREWCRIRDILQSVCDIEQVTLIFEAETLLVQAGVIESAERDIPKVVTDNFDLGDIKAKCDGFCPEIIQEAVSDNKSREGHSGHLMEGSDIDKMVGYTGSEFYCGDINCQQRKSE